MNTLKIKTLKGYNDRDGVLIHAMFQVLTDFMEKERPGERIDWEGSSPAHAEAWKELQFLYNWWHREFLPGLADVNLSTEDEMWAQARCYAKRLIDVSPHMWT